MRRLAESLMKKASELIRPSLMVAGEAAPTDNPGQAALDVDTANGSLNNTLLRQRVIPGQAALDDPSSGQNLRPSRRWLLLLLASLRTGLGAIPGSPQMTDDTICTSHCKCSRTRWIRIMTIPPQQLHARKQILERLEHALGILLIGVGFPH